MVQKQDGSHFVQSFEIRRKYFQILNDTKHEDPKTRMKVKIPNQDHFIHGENYIFTQNGLH